MCVAGKAGQGQMVEPSGGEARGRESVGLFVVSCTMSSQIIKENLIDVRQECSSTRLCLKHHRRAAQNLRAVCF